MSAHKFAPIAGSKSACTVCGKTRGAKAHKDWAASATTLDEARQDLLPEVEVDDAELAQALLDAGIDVDDDYYGNADAKQAEAASELKADDEALAKIDDAIKADAEAAAKQTAKPSNGTASIWVGWRIANAAVLVNRNSPKAAKSLAKKVGDAKPTGDLDRTVKLTAEEFEVLDGIAERFQKEGKTGPEIYSGRALRGRIAAALAKIEGK